MKAKYCIIPDTAKFFEFLAGLSFSESDLLHTRLIRPQKILDIEQSAWVIEYKAAAPVEERLTLAVADRLAAAFSLHGGVQLKCCNAEMNNKQTEEIPLPPEPPEMPEVIVTDCTGQPIPDEIPLPEEQPQNDLESYHYEENGSCGSEADAEFARAYEILYGNGGSGGKNNSNLLWGKNIKGQPRPIDEISEEENNVVIEGQFVKCFDKDGVLTSFNERELRTGRVKLSFNLSDDTNGIFVNMYFQSVEECHKFKGLIKPGVYLRIMGDAKRDRFAFDEMVIEPKGIMLVEKEERMDNAEVKRVELHCHTKMSKMDALTPMEDLVKKAIKWGHKALAITDHGVVQAFPFCYDAAEGSDLKLIFGMEGYLISDSGVEGTDIEPTDSIKKKKGTKTQLDHIIILAKNEIIGLMGKSGSGKSTLAKILLKLIACDDGVIKFNGIDITNLKNKDLKFYRKKMQFISQRPENFFDPMMSLRKTLLEPLKIHNINYNENVLQEYLEKVKLNEMILNRYPYQLSGGEIQRLSIVRALLLNPEIIILDEATSMLDISVQAQILHLLKELQIEKSLTYLFISHDKNIINWFSDRVLIMKDGKIL